MSEDTHHRHYHTPHDDDDQNVEVSVHITAPTSAAFDNVYREQANATLNFTPATHIHIGNISWPPERVFLADESQRKELASWGSRGVVVSPLLKRKDREGSSEDQERPSKRTEREGSPEDQGRPLKRKEREGSPEDQERPSKRKEREGSPKDQKHPSRHRIGSVWPVPTPLTSSIQPTTPPAPPILVPRTELRTPSKSSGIPPLETPPAPGLLVPESEPRVRPQELRTPSPTKVSGVPPQETPRAPPEILVPETSPRARPPSSCLPHTLEEEEEHRYLSQVFDSFLSSYGTIPDSQPSQIPASRIPPTAHFVAQTPIAAPTGPSFVASTPTAPSQRPSSPPTKAATPPTRIPTTPLFPRLGTGTVLTFATPAPTLSSLTLPAGFSPTPASQLSPGSNTSSPLPVFNTSSPLPTLVAPPYIITAPPPATDSNPPQVPRALVELVRLHLPDKFAARVDSITRPLRRWERGYWRVDMGAWGDPQAKKSFWNIMRNHILAGRFGMVTMSVETEERAQTSEMWTEEVVSSEMERSGNTLRVYCWGATVELVWCAAYVVAPYGGFARAVWVDAAGEVVVRMV